MKPSLIKSNQKKKKRVYQKTRYPLKNLVKKIRN